MGPGGKVWGEEPGVRPGKRVMPLQFPLQPGRGRHLGQHPGLSVLHHADELAGKVRVELAACLGLDFSQGIGRVKGLAIRPVGGEGVENVGQGQEAAEIGGGRPFQAMGVPLAVPAFVVEQNKVFFLGP